MRAATVPMEWTAIGLDALIHTESVHPVVLADEGLALWRDADGAIHVWEDRCPHRGMRLSFGFVRGTQLTCLYHGWRFGHDGGCRHVPAHPDLEPPATICAATRPVVVFRGLAMTRTVAGGALPTGEGGAWMPVRSVVIEAAEGVVRAALADGPFDRPCAPLEGWAAVWEAPAAGGRATLALQPVSPCKTALHVTSDRADVDARVALARRLAAFRDRVEQAARRAEP